MPQSATTAGPRRKRRRGRLKVWFHRARAIAWAIVGVISFPLGWADSVAIVWIASVYANSLTDWGAGEAADDREILDRLDRIEARQERILAALEGR